MKATDVDHCQLQVAIECCAFDAQPVHRERNRPNSAMLN
jgi:hypothetical protein